ncbi:S-adenosyl-L-methionine-dependent methyltransferase [Crepidotus variabilis]|uniref:S-adenosyl-L-methionine-dependent methyltransferase n=1 Tax=Crepidotus variabilis TaxID=179855 RepID=A0A9P6EIU5_9AGAR|nr:S-adenosyl-L-methionine-dependent methyltransferase [Crepidotus variabilis]
MSQSPNHSTISNSPPDLITEVDNGEDGEISSNGEESPSVEELGSDEFPLYFTERRGRLFHSGSSVYPLPVDTPEQERQTILHEAMRRLYGANYIGPVQAVLAPNPHRELAVLDVCTGNGRWALDMAAEFPHVRFIGFDHVPIATRYPLPNVRFEIHDVNTPFRWSDQSFDIVHLRATSLAVHNYQVLLQEVARVLRRGGLLISYEWDNGIHLEPSSGVLDIMTHAPSSCRFFNAINATLSSRLGISPATTLIGPFLRATEEWVEVTTAMRHVPIGARELEPDRTIAELNLGAQERYLNSIRHILEDSEDWTDEDLESMASGYLEEIRSKSGLASVLHTAHARRT